MAQTKLAFSKESKGFKKLEWIQIKSLSVVWAQAQRPLDEKHAQGIADNFDPEMFGTLAVTKPNGNGVYHIIDGHHRKAAVEKLWGDEELVPCQVFDAEDPARAAELFDHINTARKKPSPVDIFKVRVTAKSEIEVEVNKLVKASGYAIGYHNKRDDNNLTCVAALKSIHQSYGAKILTETLNTITAIWGVDNAATQGPMVKGIAEFLSEYRDIDFKRLREVIGAKYTPARLHGAARSYKELHGGPMTSAIKMLLVATYNDGIRSAAKKLQRKEVKVVA